MKVFLFIISIFMVTLFAAMAAYNIANHKSVLLIIAQIGLVLFNIVNATMLWKLINVKSRTAKTKKG